MNDTRAPIVVSFFAGADYYRKAAATLAGDCDRLGIEYDIVEIQVDHKADWIDICRRKIPFLREMQEKHRRAIFWVDVDCRFGRRPEFFGNAPYDIAGFLRGFAYIRDFDAATASRFFSPFALYFNYTDPAIHFVDLMAELEARYSGSATDDYFLQEAWAQHEFQASVMVLPPRLIGRTWPLVGEQAIYFGSSGNVSAFRSRAQQHAPPIVSPARRSAVLLHEAGEEERAGHGPETIVLLKRALAAQPENVGLAERIARLMHRENGHDAAVKFLGAYGRQRGQETDLRRRFIAQRCYEQGDLAVARRIVDAVLRGGVTADRHWAKKLLLRIDLDCEARTKRVRHDARVALFSGGQSVSDGFCDLLNAYLVEKLTGQSPRIVTRGSGMWMSGPFVASAGAHTTVWGSGIASIDDRVSPAAHFRAVRGPLTRARILAQGVACPELYGDPVLLLPRVLCPTDRGLRNALGLLLGDGEAQELRTEPDVVSLSLDCVGFRGLEGLVAQLKACDAVLTSSLYGLMLCHAYDVPVRWCRIGDATEPMDDIGFHDHLCALGVQQQPLVLARGSLVTLGLARGADQRVRVRDADLDAFLAAAPFEIRSNHG